MSNSGKDACSHVFQDSESWGRFVAFVKEAFDIFHSHPGKENRNIAEHAAKVLFHFLGQCHEEHSKKRVIKDIAIRGARGMGCQFLQALEIASKHFKPQDFGSDLNVKVTFLHAVVAAHHEPVEAYGWSELKALVIDSSTVSNSAGISLASILMYKAFRRSCEGFEGVEEVFDKIAWQDLANGAYESKNLGMNVIRGLLSGVPALQSMSQVPNSRREIVEICTTYTGKVNDLIKRNKLDASLKLSLRNSLTMLVLHFDRPAASGTPDAPVVKFLMEAVRTLRSLYPRAPAQGSELGEIPLRACWHALEHIIAMLESSPGTIKNLGPDFILETAEWLSTSLPKDELMDDLENYSRIPAFMTTGLAEKSPERQARWLNLFFINRKRWFKDSPIALDRVWIKVGLDAKLLGILRKPQTWIQDTQILDILETVTEESWNGSSKLVEGGFAGAAAEAILHIDKRRERLHPEWNGILKRVLKLMLETWSLTKWWATDEWVTEEMIRIIYPLSPHVERWLNSTDEEASETVLTFVQLIEYLSDRRPISAFTRCSAGIGIRSLFRELQRRFGEEAVGRSNTDGDVNPDLHYAYRISRRINLTNELSEACRTGQAFRCPPTRDDAMLASLPLTIVYVRCSSGFLSTVGAALGANDQAYVTVIIAGEWPSLWIVPSQ
ncbi:hypothetical protein M407DRAFT_25111 [Tulasnella calospora MUT 4182]|uniref:Uncharacterized protein n=1 Tax=Tulasnella calospora MUT 4182 TaxID=1051891 RepID=A0A0C3QGL8_9AGAM|nr:hypothetical protein M407DRAFT_25111 [Tulasnella calospora MUT 4182]